MPSKRPTPDERIDEALIGRAIAGLPYLDADALFPRKPTPPLVCLGCRGEGCVLCGKPIEGIPRSLRGPDELLGLLVGIQTLAERIRKETHPLDLEMVESELRAAHEALIEADQILEGDEDAYIEDMRDLYRRRRGA